MDKDALRKWILAVGRAGILRKSNDIIRFSPKGFSESWFRNLERQQQREAQR